ncbi:hypothetical protein Tco_1560236 [Tanacetum coccineum]
MNVEEWGIFLVIILMFERLNAAGGVQNRPTEDGRVHIVEPRAREALKPMPAESRRRRKAPLLDFWAKPHLEK